jgi:hypothetical protein
LSTFWNPFARLYVSIISSTLLTSSLPSTSSKVVLIVESESVGSAFEPISYTRCQLRTDVLSGRGYLRMFCLFLAHQVRVRALQSLARFQGHDRVVAVMMTMVSRLGRSIPRLRHRIDVPSSIFLIERSFQPQTSPNSCVGGGWAAFEWWWLNPAHQSELEKMQNGPAIKDTLGGMLQKRSQILCNRVPTAARSSLVLQD